MEILEIICTAEDDTFKRLDQMLVSKCPDLSRTAIKNLFEKGMITSDSVKLELKRTPPLNTIIKVTIPAPVPTEAIPENIPLDIIFEDEHLLIVNKVAGMVTHPAPGNYTGTLVNAVLFHCKDLQAIGDKIRPGIVHRLDKGTSGVMVVAKNKKCHEALVEIFSKHDIKRCYEAITLNPNIEKSGELRSYIDRSNRDRKKMANFDKKGKLAITNFKVLEYFKKFTHTELTLETGRTHQIRVHLSGILNAPILMDPTYGNPKNHLNLVNKEISNLIKEYPYPFLHAKLLGFTHPITKEELLFTSPPPKIFLDVLSLLQKEKLNR